MLSALPWASCALLLPPAAVQRRHGTALGSARPHVPASMLLRPEDPAKLQREIQLQLLQQKLAEYQPVCDEGQDEEPFDPKLQYYLELKIQDVLDARAPAHAANGTGCDALVQFVARRRQLVGPWTPACGAPPPAGLSFRDQHRMEQRVFGTTGLARAELLGLQALGQAIGSAGGAGIYFWRCPHSLALLLDATTPAPCYLPLVMSMCVGSAFLMLLLPALASQAGPRAASLRTAGWAVMCVCEPAGLCAGGLARAVFGAMTELLETSAAVVASCDERLGASRRTAAAADWAVREVGERAQAVWRACKASEVVAEATGRIRSACTQQYLVRELNLLTRLQRLDSLPREAF